MKKESSKKMENSGYSQKKKSVNLIVQTSHETSFDSRWAEIKIQGKNIEGRSNHVAAVFGSCLYVHGGYDVDKGLLTDFHMIDLSEASEEFVWQRLSCDCDGVPIKLKNHTAVVYKQCMYIFGGEMHTNESSNIVYIFDFVAKKWKGVKPNIDIPKVDSHCAVIHGNLMYVYGGYIPEKAQFMRDIFAFNLDTRQWKIEYKGNSTAQEPEGRSNFDIVSIADSLWLFGGTNGIHTLNDMWKFDLTSKKWSKLETKDTPQPRRGHSLLVFDKYIFMFGGIQDITKEKNDVYIFQTEALKWSKIHTSTNSIYDCSPTLKREKKSPTRSPDKLELIKVSPEKGSEKGSDAMKKILNENKQKKFLQRKKELLKQFSQKPGDFAKHRSLSPTTQSMLKTLEAIGNQESAKKELRQQIMYDDSHRLIIGKKPCARDGQSVSFYDNKMYIFGGDRHLMAFNDLYSFDLEKGVKSMDLYRST